MKQPIIGFIGQGYIGKNYANNFEERGFTVVRYSLEAPYIENKDRIADCDIVFIAVPTPSTPSGFDDSIVRNSIALTGVGKIVVIKSTIIPGTTASFQKQYTDRIIFYSPEFLSEVTAIEDATFPFSNIVGEAADDDAHHESAKLVHGVLPHAPYVLTCTSTEAELIKYAHNGSGFVEIVFFNLMYELAQKLGINWSNIQSAMEADPLVANRYANPIHKSGRGAGGHCFIKDFAALCDIYERELPEGGESIVLLRTLEAKNLELLRESGKDADLVDGVYGKKEYD